MKQKPEIFEIGKGEEVYEEDNVSKAEQKEEAKALPSTPPSEQVGPQPTWSTFEPSQSSPARASSVPLYCARGPRSDPLEFENGFRQQSKTTKVKGMTTKTKIIRELRDSECFQTKRKL